jgi:hypothetical protein
VMSEDKEVKAAETFIKTQLAALYNACCWKISLHGTEVQKPQGFPQRNRQNRLEFSSDQRPPKPSRSEFRRYAQTGRWSVEESKMPKMAPTM